MTKLFQYLKEIYYLLDEDRIKVPLLLLMFLILAIVDIVGIGSIGTYISIVTQPDIFENNWVNNWLIKFNLKFSFQELVIYLGIAMFAVFLFKGIIGIGVQYNIVRFVNNRTARIQTKLMKNYQQMTYAQYLQRNSSEYIQTIANYTYKYATCLHTMLTLTIDSIVGIMIISFLAWVNPLLVTFLILLFGMIIFAYDFFLRQKAAIAGKSQNIHELGTIKGIQEGINGFKEIRVLGGEKFFLDKIEYNSLQGARHKCMSHIIQSAPRRLLEIVIVAFIVLMVLYSIQFGDSQATIFPLIIMFGIATLRLLPSATRLSLVLHNCDPHVLL